VIEVRLHDRVQPQKGSQNREGLAHFANLEGTDLISQLISIRCSRSPSGNGFVVSCEGQGRNQEWV